MYIVYTSKMYQETTSQKRFCNDSIYTHDFSPTNRSWHPFCLLIACTFDFLQICCIRLLVLLAQYTKRLSGAEREKTAPMISLPRRSWVVRTSRLPNLNMRNSITQTPPQPHTPESCIRSGWWQSIWVESSWCVRMMLHEYSWWIMKTHDAY